MICNSILERAGAGTQDLVSFYCM